MFPYSKKEHAIPIFILVLKSFYEFVLFINIRKLMERRENSKNFNEYCLFDSPVLPMSLVLKFALNV